MCKRPNSLSSWAGVACILASAHAPAAERIFSNDELLRAGDAAYQRSDCPAAARFLFAYQQRDPPDLQASEQHRRNVGQAIDTCVKRAGAATAGFDSKSDSPGGGGTRLPKVDLSSRSQAPTNKRCNIYTDVAIAQHRANVEHRCGHAGNRWQLDRSHHYGWCMQTTPAQTVAETTERQRLLASCGM